MQAHASRGGAVKIKCRDRFTPVAAELVPRIGLGENALPERLGHKPSVALRSDRENELVRRWQLREGHFHRKRLKRRTSKWRILVPTPTMPKTLPETAGTNALQLDLHSG